MHNLWNVPRLSTLNKRIKFQKDSQMCYLIRMYLWMWQRRAGTHTNTTKRRLWTLWNWCLCRVHRLYLLCADYIWSVFRRNTKNERLIRRSYSSYHTEWCLHTLLHVLNTSCILFPCSNVMLIWFNCQNDVINSGIFHMRFGCNCKWFRRIFHLHFHLDMISCTKLICTTRKRKQNCYCS